MKNANATEGVDRVAAEAGLPMDCGEYQAGYQIHGSIKVEREEWEAVAVSLESHHHQKGMEGIDPGCLVVVAAPLEVDCCRNRYSERMEARSQERSRF